jgi:hypothetical protein
MMYKPGINNGYHMKKTSSLAVAIQVAILFLQGGVDNTGVQVYYC